MKTNIITTMIKELAQLKQEIDRRLKLETDKNFKDLFNEYGFKASLFNKLKRHTELEISRELIGTRGCNDNFYKDIIMYNEIYTLSELDFRVKNSTDLYKDLKSHLNSIQKLTKYNKYRLNSKQIEPEFKQIN